MRGAPVLVVLALAAGVRADAPPAPATVSARVEPERPTVGERFRYVQVVDAPHGTVLESAPRPERLGDFGAVGSMGCSRKSRDQLVDEINSHLENRPVARYDQPGA